MKNTKDLYIFAHLGEAQVFLKRWRAQKVSNINRVNYYQTENKFVLITGEGINQAIISTTIFLNMYEKEVQSIINLGIAASLNETILLRKIYSVGSVFSESEIGKFNSYFFHSNDKISQIKSVSTLQRVLDNDYAKKLRPYADIVDMELWGIAMVARYFEVLFYSFKIISDIAGNGNTSNEVKRMAKEFSNDLFDFIENKN